MSHKDLPTKSPAALAREFRDFSERTKRIFRGFMERQRAGEAVTGFDPVAIAQSFWEWNSRLAANPAALADAQSAYWAEMSKLFGATAQRMAGQNPAPVATPAPGDRRFRDPAWDEEVVFDHLKQSYLIYAQFAQGLADGADGLDRHAADIVSFYTRRFVEAASPSNFAHTNPAVIRKARETGGRSLSDGFANFLRDLERGKGQLRITRPTPTPSRSAGTSPVPRGR